MNAKVKVSLVGHGFDFQFGQVVDRDEFLKAVGAGGEALIEDIPDEPKLPLGKAAKK